MELGDASDYIQNAIKRKDIEDLNGIKEWLQDAMLDVDAALMEQAAQQGAEPDASSEHDAAQRVADKVD